MTRPDEYRPDPHVIALLRELDTYSQEHPLAEIGVFRRDKDRLSVRIIDPDFRELSLRQRHDTLWTLLRAAGAPADMVSVLLLLTPDEAASAHVDSTVRFDDPNGGPVRFRSNSQIFLERVLGHDVFVTVGTVDPGEGRRRYCVWLKFGYPPGIIDADDYGLGADEAEPLPYGLSVDAGELLRAADREPHCFESPEAAKAAALEAAKERLSRLAAA